MLPLLALFIGVTTAAVPASPADTAKVQSTLRGILQNYVNRRGRIERITAAAVAVNRGPNAPLITAGVGAAPSSLFQIGSNTKSFTATLVLQLEAAGKLNIDEPIGKWLPQYPAWKNVTLHRLLDMTGGIATYDNDQAFQRAYAASPYRYYKAPELIGFVYPRNGKPKVLNGWNYSNTGYLLTQLVLERVTGKPYGELLRTRIFEPLGLRDTYYDPHALPASARKRLVAGYFYSNDPDNRGLRPLYNTDVRPYSLSWTQAAGGIVATPADVTRWARALNAGTLLPAKQHAEMQQLVSMKTGRPIVRTTPGDPRGFALGMGEMLMPKIGRVWFYEGETLGYRVTQVQLPKSGAVISLGLNSQPNAKEDKTGELMGQIIAALNLR
jgi:D-alanyl-D-alanine carboxypeptidase